MSLMYPQKIPVTLRERSTKAQENFTILAKTGRTFLSQSPAADIVSRKREFGVAKANALSVHRRAQIKNAGFSYQYPVSLKKLAFRII